LSRLERWRGDVNGPFFPIDRTMPHAPAESRDVDLIVVQRIGNHALSPLEVEPGNAIPMKTTVSQ
jgi:hypothetical protein